LPFLHALRSYALSSADGARDRPPPLAGPWRRWLAAFTARRRRHADRVILQHLRGDRVPCDADFRLDFERRLLWASDRAGRRLRRPAGWVEAFVPPSRTLPFPTGWWRFVSARAFQPAATASTT
jgi:hypothetical protein